MLQTVNNRFNVCFRSIVLPFMLLTILVTNTSSNYATMRAYAEVKLLGFIGFPIVSIATLAMLKDTLFPSYKMSDMSKRLIGKVRTSPRILGIVYTIECWGRAIFLCQANHGVNIYPNNCRQRYHPLPHVLEFTFFSFFYRGF